MSTGTEQSKAWFDRAKTAIPGGVNSPVRAFNSVGGTPRFMVRGEGPHLWDADGNRYVDLVSSWGPMILGHAHPAVVEAARAAADSAAAARGQVVACRAPRPPLDDRPRLAVAALDRVAAQWAAALVPVAALAAVAPLDWAADRAVLVDPAA